MGAEILDRDRLKVLVVFISIFLVLCGYFYFTQRTQTINRVAKLQTQNQSSSVAIQNNPELLSMQNMIDDLKAAKLTVHVAGAVNNPGVYSLPAMSRVVDAVEQAGGATESANLDEINLADYIKDGQKIEVPSINKSNNALADYKLGDNLLNSSVLKNSSEKNNQTKDKNELVNINTASASELQSLPGIGATIANSIIEYREENGDFQTTEELKNVSRIGDKTFDKLKDLVTVD